jgi:hypothetical protein
LVSTWNIGEEMKILIPCKTIKNINADGTFKDGLIQYQLQIDGANDGKFKSLGIGDISIADAIVLANTAEEIE